MINLCSLLLDFYDIYCIIYVGRFIGFNSFKEDDEK